MATGDTLQGRRLPDGPTKGVFFARGDYMRDETGAWWCCPPAGGLGQLEHHTIIEHEDGTITVSPSIQCEGHWHGYLERGVWREG